MDLGISNATNIIIGGATDFFPQFIPIGIFLGGILIAFWILQSIIETIRGHKNDEEFINKD